MHIIAQRTIVNILSVYVCIYVYTHTHTHTYIYEIESVCGIPEISTT